MPMKKLVTLLTFFGLILCAHAQTLIPFQGRLTDQDGKPYSDSQYTIVFQIYDQAVGDRSIWSERHERVGVINGTINVFLGSISPLTAVNFSTTRYLGITVDGDNNPNSPDPEMVPRQMIIPAFWSRNSDKLGGFGWSDLLTGGATNPLTGRISGEKIAEGTLAGGAISDGTITGVKIGPREISGINLSVGSVGMDQLQEQSVGFSKLGQREMGREVDVGGIALSVGITSISLGASQADGNTDHPELHVRLKTSGRPVLVGLVKTADTGPGNVATVPDSVTGGIHPQTETVLTYYRNGRQIDSVAMSVNKEGGFKRLAAPLGAFTIIDFPGASAEGFDYSVRFSTGGGGMSVQLTNIRLIAFEL
jgi:hypothetical protein